MLHFEHHMGRTKGTDLGRASSKIFDDYDFDLSYIVAVVTDTTGNMNTFGCYLQSKGVIHLYCVDHNLHLCAEKPIRIKIFLTQKMVRSRQDHLLNILVYQHKRQISLC